MDPQRLKGKQQTLGLIYQLRSETEIVFIALLVNITPQK